MEMTTQRILKGIPASDGIAIGPVFCYVPAELTIPICAAGSEAEEMARYEQACERARSQTLHPRRPFGVDRTVDTARDDIWHLERSHHLRRVEACHRGIEP